MLTDDATINTSEQDLPSINVILRSCISDIVDWIHLRYLSLNPSKTKYEILTTQQLIYPSPTYYTAIDILITSSHFDLWRFIN